MAAQPKKDSYQKERDTREHKACCIELACRTLGNSTTPDEHVAAAEKYFKFVTS